MLKPDDQSSHLENFRALDVILWLQKDGLCKKLRSLLRYLPTSRTSCFFTQGIQVDDPKNALSYCPALKFRSIVTSSMHINHLYLHFEVMHIMKFTRTGECSHPVQYNTWIYHCPSIQVVTESTAAFCLKATIFQSIQLFCPSVQYLICNVQMNLPVGVRFI